MPDTDSARLDHLFHALSDPQRRAMVAQLVQGPASMKELAAPLDLGLPSALKHLQVLENSGVVSSRKIGRTRTFKVEKAGLDHIEHWLDAHQRQLNLGFDRLEQLMASMKEEPET